MLYKKNTIIHHSQDSLLYLALLQFFFTDLFLVYLTGICQLYWMHCDCEIVRYQFSWLYNKIEMAIWCSQGKQAGCSSIYFSKEWWFNTCICLSAPLCPLHWSAWRNQCAWGTYILPLHLPWFYFYSFQTRASPFWAPQTHSLHLFACWLLLHICFNKKKRGGDPKSITSEESK